MIDTDRRLTVYDTAEMYDLIRITMQCIFQMGVQTIEVNLVWRRIFFFFLERIETYKIGNISGNIATSKIDV